jgi:hypothetical protein
MLAQSYAIAQSVPIFIFVVIALVAAGAAYYRYYARKKRRSELAYMAAQYGLKYSTEDPFNTLFEPFQLLQKGDGRGVENMMWGKWQGLDVRVFDYWYYEENTDSKGGRSRTYYRFDCVISPVGAACSHLTIDHENLFTHLGDHLGFRDIDFESDEFNRKYRVKSNDPRFASDLVDARMIRWLLASADGYAFEVTGDRILTSHKQLRAMDMVPLIGTTKAFLDHIPRVVYSLYPKPT